MRGLTGRQLECLEFIERHLEQNQVSPTVREIGQALGLSSTGSVRDLLNALERKGAIKVGRGRRRSIEILQNQDNKGLPLLGHVSAGLPVMPCEEVDRWQASDLLPWQKADYLLQVSGDSMRDDGVLDGDVIFVEDRQEVSNGEMVVAMVPGHGATLKRLYRHDDGIHLVPANSAYQTLVVKELEIQGVACGVVRKMDTKF